MADLIDRDAVLKTMSGANIGGYITEKIMNIPAVNCWIPCSERLPKSVGNKVLVFCTGEDVNDYVGFGHYENFKHIETWYNLETSLPFADWGLTVTHWMPLPEPPEKR